MKIHNLEILITDKESKENCSFREFADLFIASSKKEFDEFFDEFPEAKNKTQLIVPRKFLTECVNKFVDDKDRDADDDKSEEEELAIIHILAISMVEHLNTNNTHEWEEKLAFLLKNGADINFISSEKHTPLDFIERFKHMYGPDDDGKTLRATKKLLKKHGALEVAEVTLRACVKEEIKAQSKHTLFAAAADRSLSDTDSDSSHRHHHYRHHHHKKEEKISPEDKSETVHHHRHHRRT